MIKHVKGGFKVVSESGKNLGGPYKTEKEAQERLDQVENTSSTKKERESSMSFLTMQNDILTDLSGLPRVIVKAGLNDAYVGLARKWPWTFLEKVFKLATTATYTTGTISATVGSTTITGVGTTFTAAMVGLWIRLNGEDQFYKIATRTSDTSITIERAYVGSAALSGDTFQVFQHIYTLDTALSDLYGITYDSPLLEKTQESLNSMDPQRSSSGTPTHYSVYGKSSTGYMQVELWPHPTTAIMLSYYGLVIPTTLSADSDVPLLAEDVITDRARVSLALKFARLRPSEAQLVAAFIPQWREDARESESDLISEDNRIRSAKESVKDVMTDSMYPGEPFWVDRNSL